MADEIISRIQKKLVKEGIGAVVVCSSDNITYTAGYEVPSQAFPIRERLITCVITAGGKDLMLVPDMEYSLAKSNARLSDIRMYNEFTQNPIDELCSILQELGVTGEQIAIEDDFIPWTFLSHLYKLMPEVRFVAAKKFMCGVRLIKTPGELEKLRKVNKIAEQSHYYAAAHAHAGLSELEYTQFIYNYLFSNGVETLNRLVVGSGERSEHGNANPTTRVFGPGEIVRADIFAKIGGYLSDVARTAVVGKPNAEQVEKWQKIIEARSLILDMIRPGASTMAIYNAFNRYFEKARLTPINFVGHGLGITLHEEPYISLYHDTELQPGMVLAIEPLYFTQGEGYQIEEIVAVTESGYELMTDCSDSTDLLEIKL